MMRLIVSIAAALAATTPLHASEPARSIYSDIPQVKAAQEKLGWADAVIAGDTIYVSGVIAASRDGETSLEPAYDRAFQQLADILERAGASWADVVEIRSYHTDVHSQIGPMAAARRRFRTAPDPAWSAVGTSGLLNPAGLTEIALVARLPKEKP